MRFAEIAETSKRVAATSERSGKIAILAELVRRLGADEVGVGVTYLGGRLRQSKLGLGVAAFRRALGSEPAARPTVELLAVDRALEEIAATKGAGSAARRTEQLGRLLASATESERDLLFRLAIGELRQGALEGVLTEAVAAAYGVPLRDVRRALMSGGDLGAVAAALAREGAAGLAAFSIRLFEPVQPMLADSAADMGDALERLGEAGLEWKVDGARVQVHKSGDDVEVWSRRLNRVTPAVPEVVEAVRALPARELVLDGETIALAADGRPLAFQTTMRRYGRRLDVERLRAEIPLATFAFDLLWLDGRSLVDEPSAERWRALASALPQALRVPRLVSADPGAASAFFDSALAAGHEGVIAKSLAAPYEAGRRGAAWLKVKTAHTLDLVVLAVEWGSGRRRGWLSNLHLGARDPATGGFVMLGKTFKGMTDEMLRWQTDHFLSLEIGREEGIVHVRPELVVEIAFDGVQSSPHYPGGVALRFARVKRYRLDKRAEDADTIERVRAIRDGKGV